MKAPFPARHSTRQAERITILKELLDVVLVLSRNSSGIKPIECRTAPVALLQDGLPTQPCLHTFQDKKLEHCSIILDRYTRFRILIGH
jgi:hypothetical protein